MALLEISNINALVQVIVDKNIFLMFPYLWSEDFCSCFHIKVYVKTFDPRAEAILKQYFDQL